MLNLSHNITIMSIINAGQKWSASYLENLRFKLFQFGKRDILQKADVCWQTVVISQFGPKTTADSHPYIY